ncbi:MAG: hypothetical protein U9R70_09450 [Pseudomonadota bacterium]|nr:hypothetical protein [Pseudomonadota bacterium]
MSVGLLFATVLLAGGGQAIQPSNASGPVQVEDVIVNAQRFEDAAEQYVGAVADPAGARGLARWRDGVCIGVINLRADVAQEIADRLGDTARGLGLQVGEPGCRPNIKITASDEPSKLAGALVSQSFRAFHTGGSGTDQGRARLDAFINTDRPVRWWQVSYPGNAETGEVAVRLPGYYNTLAMALDGNDVLAYAPSVRVTSPTRLRSSISDFLYHILIILDVDQVQSASVGQLSDYLSMVAFAQIDPAGQTRGFATILNLFSNPEGSPSGLTSWDRAYLDGLYQSDLTRIQIGNQASALASSARAMKVASDRMAIDD